MRRGTQPDDLRAEWLEGKRRVGLTAGLSAYAFWGVLPLYLKFVGFAGPFERGNADFGAGALCAAARLPNVKPNNDKTRSLL